MPYPNADLVCTLHFPKPGHRSPTIRLATTEGEMIASISTSEPVPHLPLPDESVRSISALDILEHVHDEQTWLAELARILMQNGELLVRVPLENALAWVDALNIYRYVSDTTGRGTHPSETIPTGWHRHYAPRDLPAILKLAGFEVGASDGEGLPLGELPHLVGLVVGKALLQRPGAERRLFELRSRLNHRSRLRLPIQVAARLMVRATLTHPGYQPDPDLDESDRPEEESANPLE